MGSNDPADREDIALSTSELDDVLSSAEIRSESGNDEESNLEQYGIWIKVEPETLESEAAGPFQVADLGPRQKAGRGPAPVAGAGQLTPEEEQLLGELEAEAEAPTLAARRPAVETADFEGLEKDLQELDSGGGEAGGEEDLDLDLEDLAAEPDRESEVEVPLSDSIPELDSLEEAPEAKVRAPAPSDQILKKIEQDLKQIKLEIQNLKKELAGREGGAHGAGAPGFFSEEEDDSIALTGDELDNILNTAEITEEPAGAAGAEEDLQAAAGAEEAMAVEELPELALPEAEELQEASLPEAVEELGEAALEEPGLEEPGLEEPALAEPAEELDLLEPGSLSAEPEAAAAGAQEKPPEVDLDLGNLGEEPALSDELELEELDENASELALEEQAEAPLPNAEELGLEEAAPAEGELSLEELQEQPAAAEEPGELAAEPLELESAAEAEAPLELVEELPDLSLADEQAVPAAEAEAEPVELELMEEPAALEPAEGALEGLGAAARPAPADRTQQPAGPAEELPEDLREDVKSVLSYLDQLLEALPEEKIKQFAQSEYFGVYKRLFEELGLGA